jgi:hypothetical protein
MLRYILVYGDSDFFIDLADVYVDRKIQFLALPNVGQIIFQCRTFFLN